MKDFESWYAEMKTNFLWWQRTQEMYGRKNLAQIASEVHLYLLAKDELKKNDWVAWRVLFQAFCRKSPDVTTISLQQEEIAPSAKPIEDPPLTGEARQQKLQEWKEMLNEMPALKPIAPLTAKERLENQGWRPMPEEIREPTEEEKLIALENHKKALTAARAKVFREKNPTGTVKDLQKYLKKFNDI